MINHEYVKQDWREAPSKAMRDGFGEAVTLLGGEREDVVVLTADLGKSLRVLPFRDKYKDRYFNVGVSEQNMMGVAAGLAIEGYVPFTCSFGVFSPARNWDQVRISVSLTNSNVKIIGSHAGLSVGENGASHQALEDVSTMRVLPNMTVTSPCDYTQTKAATREAAGHKGPLYMRFPRAESPDFTKDVPFDIGKAYVYREGSDLTIFVSGIFVHRALVISERLSKDGISAEVINVSSIKPIDRETILKSASKTGRAVSLEDHQEAGGMGSAILETLSLNPVPFKIYGVSDSFGESGGYEELYAKHSLDEESLYKAFKSFVE